MDKRIRLCFLGVDGTGKTSLAKAVANIMGWTYYKDTLYKKMFFGNVDYTIHSAVGLLQYMEATPESAVFDRFFWDEMVYGPVLQRRTLDMRDYQFMDKFAASIGFRIVYLHKDKKMHDDLIETSNQPHLTEQYQRMLEWSSCPVLQINSTDERLDNQLKLIRQWLV
jgi:deoxyadenosine/deoxycytidine kinase